MLSLLESIQTLKSAGCKLVPLNEFSFGFKKPEVNHQALWLDRARRAQDIYNSLIEDYYPESKDLTDLSKLSIEELREYVVQKESDLRRLKHEIYKKY